jgi:hypothetical protein
MTVETLLTTALFVWGLAVPWGIAAYWRWKARRSEKLAALEIRPIAISTFAYVVAFNLTFFLQELFLVVPKALVPGLEPTLYHNNHGWEGEAPIADLFQGTGALAILLSGLLFAAIATRQKRPSLLVLWLAFHGLFQSLPQFVVAAITPANDVGQAYDYLALGTVAEVALALLALAGLAVAGLGLGRTFLRGSWNERQLADVRSRFAYLTRIAGLAALLALPLVVLFRIPREPIEVLLPPILVPLFGFAWLQLAAVWPGRVSAFGRKPDRLLPLVIGAAALLAIFQLVLRPGIAF